MILREWLPDGSPQFWGYYAIATFGVSMQLTLIVLWCFGVFP